eukprot:229823_1
MANKTKDFCEREKIKHADNLKIIGDKYRILWNCGDVKHKPDIKLMNQIQIECIKSLKDIEFYQNDDIDEKYKYAIKLRYDDKDTTECYWFFKKNIRDEWLTHIDFCMQYNVEEKDNDICIENNEESTMNVTTTEQKEQPKEHEIIESTNDNNENLADITDCTNEELMDIVSNHILPKLKHELLVEYADKIIEYFSVHEINGKKLKEITRKEFGKAIANYTNHKKIIVPAMKLYKELLSFDLIDYNSDNENEDKLMPIVELSSNYSNTNNESNDKLITYFKSNETTDEIVYDFGFGENVDYWNKKGALYIAPKYRKLKLELLMNEIATISRQEYWDIYIKSITFINNEKKKVKYGNNVRFLFSSDLGRVTEKYFNVYNGDLLTVNHMICLVVYTDKTDVQRELKTKCRKDVNQLMEDFLKQNSEIVHWCRLIMESCKLYGRIMNTNETFYTGISCKLLFQSFIEWFICPISTSADKEIAIRFTNETGIILALKCTSQSRYIDTESFSSFGKQERERLFCAAKLQIQNIIDVTTKRSYYNFINGIKLFDKIINGE